MTTKTATTKGLPSAAELRRLLPPAADLMRELRGDRPAEEVAADLSINRSRVYQIEAGGGLSDALYATLLERTGRADAARLVRRVDAVTRAG